MLFALILLSGIAGYVLSKDCIRWEPLDNYESLKLVLNNIRDLDGDIYLKFDRMISQGLDVDFELDDYDRIALEAMIRERFLDLYGIIVEKPNNQIGMADELPSSEGSEQPNVESNDSEADSEESSEADTEEAVRDLIDDVLDEDDRRISQYIQAYTNEYKDRAQELNNIVDELFKSEKNL